MKYFYFFNFIEQVFSGNTIYRILFNWRVKKNCKNLIGKVLDLASGSDPSYHRYLPSGIKIIKSDYQQKDGIDKVVDFNQKLPFADNSIDNILFFNALYTAK